MQAQNDIRKCIAQQDTENIPITIPDGFPSDERQSDLSRGHPNSQDEIQTNKGRLRKKDKIYSVNPIDKGYIKTDLALQIFL